MAHPCIPWSIGSYINLGADADLVVQRKHGKTQYHSSKVQRVFMFVNMAVETIGGWVNEENSEGQD